jgi:ABC-type dipeptide/oligopeptide/nickel transport system permease subunit
MPRQEIEIPYISRKKEVVKKEEKVAKRVILWTIKNIKFLILPGSHLEDLISRQKEYEIIIKQKKGLKRFSSPLFLIGIIIIILISTIAVFPDWLSPYTYLETIAYTGVEQYQQSYSPPSPAHPLGQTFVGYDILARIIYGARPVLLFATISTLIAILLGVVLGALSGYYEGWLDAIIMRGMDIVLSFPGVIFAIVFIVILGRSFYILLIIYGLIGMPYFARLVRANVLKEKELPYVAAGKVSGAKNIRVIFRHILPNCILPLIVAVSFNIGRNILSLAILGFLRYGGVGWIEWGYDISLAINSFLKAPWAVFYPGLMISLSVIGFLLVGDGLSETSLMGQELL